MNVAFSVIQFDKELKIISQGNSELNQGEMVTEIDTPHQDLQHSMKIN